MSAPAIHVVLTLEEPPRIFSDARDEQEGARLYDWITAHPEYAVIVNRALELARLERAA